MALATCASSLLTNHLVQWTPKYELTSGSLPCVSYGLHFILSAGQSNLFPLLALKLAFQVPTDILRALACHDLRGRLAVEEPVVVRTPTAVRQFIRVQYG